MKRKLNINDNDIDNHVDHEIENNIMNKKNFFMFAGAGSGKTRSLVNALIFIKKELGDELSLKSKQVAVITYTNAASTVISQRIGDDSLFAISTIHSFLWELIKPFQRDIKSFMKNKVTFEIEELKKEQSNTRNKKDRSADIQKACSRLENIDKISKFKYSPNGENVDKESLNHSEVISIGTEFISNENTMQQVLISKFPIILIDESQDTKKELVDAILKVTNGLSDDFIVGMFGDTMQRIYMDGKEKLETYVSDWEQPKKIMNHRSNKRIVDLANKIRSTIDDKQQQARSDKADGVVRLFISSNEVSKYCFEDYVYNKMAEITSDEKWKIKDERKTLVLVHRMVAKRLGFEALDEALSKKFDQSFRDGNITELNFLMKTIFPIVCAKRNNNNFEVMKIYKESSSILNSEHFIESSRQMQILNDINNNIVDLTSLWDNEQTLKCIDIYKKLYEMNIFHLPSKIEEIINDNNDSDVDEKIQALRKGLSVSFDELRSYWDYVNDKTQFSTQHGIKGLEFDRVAVIMDDMDANWFNYSYDKLLGAKDMSDTDKKNENEGGDNSISRTKRLFYVACTRAKESLALIMYTNNVAAVKNNMICNKWFTDEEIIILDKDIACL